jgi:hypothetical protein
MAQDVDSLLIEEIDGGAIQQHRLPVPQERPAFSVQERRPLGRDLSFQFELHCPSVFLNLRDFEHRFILLPLFA